MTLEETLKDFDIPFGMLPKFVWDFSGWCIVHIPYECSECNITFDCLYNKNKHMEIVHP